MSRGKQWKEMLVGGYGEIKTLIREQREVELSSPHNPRVHPTVGVGVTADRKRVPTPTAGDPGRYADKA